MSSLQLSPSCHQKPHNQQRPIFANQGSVQKNLKPSLQIIFFLLNLTNHFLHRQGRQFRTGFAKAHFFDQAVPPLLQTSTPDRQPPSPIHPWIFQNVPPPLDCGSDSPLSDLFWLRGVKAHPFPRPGSGVFARRNGLGSRRGCRTPSFGFFIHALTTPGRDCGKSCLSSRAAVVAGAASVSPLPRHSAVAESKLAPVASGKFPAR